MTQAELLKEIHRVDDEWQKAHVRCGQRCEDIETEVRGLVRNLATEREVIAKMDVLLGELGRRKTDFDSLRFPPRVIAVVATSIVGILLYFGNALYGVQSKLTVLSDQNIANEQIAKARQEIADARADAKTALDAGMRNDVTELKRQAQLTQLQVQAIQTAMAAKGIK